MEQYHFTNDESGTEGWASFASGASFHADLDVAKQESIFDVSWPIGDEGFDVTHATPAPLGREASLRPGRQLPAASRMSAATFAGWDTINACEPSLITMVFLAFARSAIKLIA